MKKLPIILTMFGIATALSQSITPVDVGPRIPPPTPVVGPDGKTYPQAPYGGTQNQQPGVVYEPPAPVIIDGKKASELDDDELKDFLSTKIQTMYQEPGSVELLRVAPGYALTVTFDEPVSRVVLGDSSIVLYQNQGRTLVLFAHQRSGDTDMQLIFPGNKILNYHIFIAPNFITAQSTIRVISTDSSDSTGAPKSPYIDSNDDIDIGAITKIIANYDALAQEKSLNTRDVRRLPVFRKSDITSFEIYYIYLFKNGPAAISYSFTNPFNYPIKYDESKLRIQVGSMQFVPDFVNFNTTTLAPGQSTTGFAIMAHPPFSFKQPFELIWK